MENSNLILVEHFCTHWNIQPSFIESLNEFGLVEVILMEERLYLAPERLKDVEKMIRLHYDLNINMEGIDVVSNLLQQIDKLQHELRIAQEQLKHLGEK